MLAKRDMFGFNMLDELLFNSVLEPFEKIKTEDPVQISLKEDENNYFLRGIVPGFQEKDINISVKNRKITVSGKIEMSRERKNIFSSSRSSFAYSYYLPQDAIPDEISADLQNGILVVTIPKWNPGPEKSERQIPIKYSLE